MLPSDIGRDLHVTSRSADKALIKNNVRVGGEVAIEYARLLKEVSVSSSS